MRKEARANGGHVPKMVDGGISASMQSIGAMGYVKADASLALSAALQKAGIKAVTSGPNHGIRFIN